MKGSTSRDDTTESAIKFSPYIDHPPPGKKGNREGEVIFEPTY
jgi:hypothetical protein